MLNKVKLVREEINNKIVQNLAYEIVSFKDGYFLTKPAFYVSRKKDETKAEEINILNDYLYLSGKQEADNSIVDWFHTVGIGVLYVKSDADNVIQCYDLDPRQAFCVYSRRPGNEPLLGVDVVMTSENGSKVALIYAITKDFISEVKGT